MARQSSREEYRWIRGAAYQAIGAPLVDIDFARIAAEAKSGVQSSGDAFKGAFDGPAPAANLTLVERYRKQLEQNLALASFGL